MKRIIAFFMSLLFVATIFQGCALNTNEAGDNEAESNQSNDDEIIKVNQISITGEYVFDDNIYEIINNMFDYYLDECYSVKLTGFETLNDGYDRSEFAKKYALHTTVTEREITVPDEFKNKTEIKIDGKTISIEYAGTTTDDYGRVRYNYKKSKDVDQIIISLDERGKLVYYNCPFEDIIDQTKEPSVDECREKAEQFLISEALIDPKEYTLEIKKNITGLRTFIYEREIEGVKTSDRVSVYVNQYNGAIDKFQSYCPNVYEDDFKISIDKSAIEQKIFDVIQTSANAHESEIMTEDGTFTVAATPLFDTAKFRFSFTGVSDGVMCVYIYLEIDYQFNHLDNEGNVIDAKLFPQYFEDQCTNIYVFNIFPEV